MEYLIAQLNELQSKRSELQNLLAINEDLIRQLENKIGEITIKRYFTNHPDLKPLSFGDKVLDNRGIYHRDNIWVVHSVDETGSFALRLPDMHRVLIMFAHYDWLMEMRQAYLELSITDNSPSLRDNPSAISDTNG